MSEVIIIIHVACRSGGMADAHGSGPCVGNNMRVQVPSPALCFIERLRIQYMECGSVGIGRRARLRIL